MKARVRVVTLAAVLSILPTAGFAQYNEAVEPPQPYGDVPAVAAPAEPQPATAPSGIAGQWVYTDQYGWIWVPYAESYTSVPANGTGSPYQYVYYPAWNAWTWIVAPWVWGIGPWPYFGAYGPVRYAWYGHGWWRYPTRWHFAVHPGYHGPAYYGGHGYYGGHAYRGAPGYHGAPAYRGAPAYHGAPAYRGAPVNQGVRPAPVVRGGYAPRAPAYAPRAGFAPRTSYAPAPSRGGFGGQAAFAPAPSRGGFGGHAAFAPSRGGFSGGGRAAGGGGHAPAGGGRGGHR